MRRVNQDEISRGVFIRKARAKGSLKVERRWDLTGFPQGSFSSIRTGRGFLRKPEFGLEHGGKRSWEEMKIADRNIVLPILSFLIICTVSLCSDSKFRTTL